MTAANASVSEPTREEPRFGRRLAAYSLVALMALGSMAMWVGSPIGWLWIASQLVTTKFPTGGGYLLVIAGLIVTTILLGRALAALDRAYSEILGVQRARVRHGWHESASAGRGERGRDDGVLERVMVVSVAFALLGMAAWFVLIAGSPLPS